MEPERSPRRLRCQASGSPRVRPPAPQQQLPAIIVPGVTCCGGQRRSRGSQVQVAIRPSRPPTARRPGHAIDSRNGFSRDSWRNSLATPRQLADWMPPNERRAVPAFPSKPLTVTGPGMPPPTAPSRSRRPAARRVLLGVPPRPRAAAPSGRPRGEPAMDRRAAPPARDPTRPQVPPPNRHPAEGIAAPTAPPNGHGHPESPACPLASSGRAARFEFRCGAADCALPDSRTASRCARRTP